MTTQRKPKTVTIPQAEYSALLGVVAAHRADAEQVPSKVLEHYDSVTRKPKAPTPRTLSKTETVAPTPKVDRGGRVYLVEGGKIWEGRKGADRWCSGCDVERCTKDHATACHDRTNGGRGNLILRRVQAVG